MEVVWVRSRLCSAFVLGLVSSELWIPKHVGSALTASSAISPGNHRNDEAEL